MGVGHIMCVQLQNRRKQNMLYDVFVFILNTIIELAQIKKEIRVTKAIGRDKQILE